MIFLLRNGLYLALCSSFENSMIGLSANSSSISDGAAALVLMRQSEAERRGLTPLARIVATSSHAQAPAWFTTAPIGAMKKVLDAAGWQTKDVGLYEINEAFAVVTMAAIKDLGLDPAKVNVNGGACGERGPGAPENQTAQYNDGGRRSASG